MLEDISERNIFEVSFIPKIYSNAKDEVKTTIVRDGTIHQDEIEIRRVFKHPNFKFPSLYDDIAVAELGIFPLTISKITCL